MVKVKWFFPTNSENLKSIFQYGLLCGADGYKKNFSDVSKKFANHIPVFSDQYEYFYKQLEFAQEEDVTLPLCLVEIDIPSITRGNVVVGTEQVDVMSLKDTTDIPLNLPVLIPSPLPLTCIKTVLFKDKKEVAAFNKQVKAVGGIPEIKIPIDAVTKKQLQTLFSPPKKPNRKKVGSLFNGEDTAGTENDQEYGDSLGQEDLRLNIKRIDYRKIYSFGGLICLLFYFSKNGKKSNDELKRYCNRNGQQIDGQSSSGSDYEEYGKAIKSIFYINHDRHSENSEPRFIIMSHVVRGLIEKDQKEAVTSTIIELKSDALFAKLEAVAAERLKEVAGLLEDFYKNKIDQKTSTTFEEAQESQLKKILLLLTHRKNIEELLSQKMSVLDALDEEDLIVSAMLFGIRAKYNKIPVELRQYNNLQEFVSYKMAQYAHDIYHTGITFKKPQQPKTVYDIIALSPNNGKKIDFIKSLQKTIDLEGCFCTEFSGNSVKDYINTIRDYFTCQIKQKIGAIFGSDIEQCSDFNLSKIRLEGVVSPCLIINEFEYFKKIRDVQVDDKIYNNLNKKV